jgi:hypothetical protein
MISLRRLLGPSITFCGLTSLAACGGEDPEPAPQTDASVTHDAAPTAQSDAGAAHDASSPPVVVDPPRVETSFDVAKAYAGQYVGKVTLRKVESVGALGSMNALVTLLGTFEISADAATQQVTLKTAYCRATLAGEGMGLLAGAGVLTPDVVMTSTQIDPVPFSANRRADGTVAWSVPEVHGPVGWTWQSSSDALPTKSSDARVKDQDGDGNPGVTTMVTLSGSGSPVYVVQTLRDTYGGTAAADGTLTGAVADRSEQIVLGSPNPLLSVATLQEQPDANTADNIIRLRKVDRAVACADLVQQVATYFP